MARFDPSELPASTLVPLLTGGTFVLVDEDEDGVLRSTTSAALVDASPSVVREVITDFERYPEWVPQVSRAKVVATKGQSTDVEFTLSFKFGVFFSKSLSYGVRYKSKGGDTIEWERVGGDFDENRGTWTLVPLERAKRTAVFYNFYVDLASTGSMVKMALKATPQMEVAIATSTAVLMARAVRARLDSSGGRKT